MIPSFSLYALWADLRDYPGHTILLLLVAMAFVAITRVLLKHVAPRFQIPVLVLSGCVALLGMYAPMLLATWR